MPGALEGLPQPDVDFKGVVAARRRRRDRGRRARLAMPRDRHGNVKSDGSDRRVIPHARAGTDAEFVGGRLEAGADLSGVHEYDGAEIGAEALPQFETARRNRRTSDRRAVGELRPDRLVAVTADGTAAAAVEALVRRQAEFPRPLRKSRKRAGGEHRTAGIGGQQVIQVKVPRDFDLADDEGGVGMTERKSGSHPDRSANPALWIVER